jgi:hypothetical protein
MGMVGRNRSFMVALLVILVCGLAILGGFTAIRVLAVDSTATTTAATSQVNYNTAGSFGITGYAPVTVTVDATTPKFVAEPLENQRGVILLVYVKGAAADDEMLANFNKLKSQYAAQASFFNFEARQVPELGNMLAQLKANTPPLLAVIQGDGKVSQLYTGWVDVKTMEQVISDAVSAQ